MTAQSPAGSPEAYVMDLVLAKIKTYALGVFADLGIADLIADSPKSVQELAQATQTHTPSLARLLRTLAGLGIVRESSFGKYGLTDAGALLRSDLPQSMRGLAILFGSEFHGKAWARLAHSIRTGEAAFNDAYGMSLFDHLEDNPELTAAFDKGMTASSIAQSQAVVDAYDFSGIRVLVDVGGGHGTLLATILKRYPTLKGILVERPQVAAAAEQLLNFAGVGERVQRVAADIFDHVPEGGDAYIMKRVIHDWDDARAVRILENCRNGMQPEGRVLVVDAVIDDSDAALYAKLLDIEMLVLSPSGKERTESEFRNLFSEAGLRLERIVNTSSPLKVLEALVV